MKLIDWLEERISALTKQQEIILREIEDNEKELLSWKNDLNNNIETIQQLEKLLVRLQAEEADKAWKA